MASKKSHSSGGLMQYWGKQAHYTAFVHAAIGVGAGLLLQPYLAQGDNPATGNIVGWCLLLLGVLGHLYAMVA